MNNSSSDCLCPAKQTSWPRSLAETVKCVQHEDVCTQWARHLTETSAIPNLHDVVTSEGSWQKFLIHSGQSRRWPWPAYSFCNAQAATLLEFLVPLTNCFVCRWFCVVLGLKLPLHHHNWLSFGKFQDVQCFLITCTCHVSLQLHPSGETCKYAMVPITQTNLEICSFLPCLSWVLRCRVQKFWRNLWITLYIIQRALKAQKPLCYTKPMKSPSLNRMTTWLESIVICWLTIHGVWIGKWIYWTLINHNYK
jgi:hypothetical protein